MCVKFPELELHLLEIKLDLVFMSETGNDPSISVQEPVIPAYSLLIVKHDPRISDGAYIKDGIPCRRDLKTKILISRSRPLFKVPFLFLYRSQGDGTAMFDKIARLIISSPRIPQLAFIFVATLIFATKSG